MKIIFYYEEKLVYYEKVPSAVFFGNDFVPDFSQFIFFSISIDLKLEQNKHCIESVLRFIFVNLRTISKVNHKILRQLLSNMVKQKTFYHSR